MPSPVGLLLPRLTLPGVAAVLKFCILSSTGARYRNCEPSLRVDSQGELCRRKRRPCVPAGLQWGPLGVLLPQIVLADKVTQRPCRQKCSPVVPKPWGTIWSQLSAGGGGDAGEWVPLMLLIA